MGRWILVGFGLSLTGDGTMWLIGWPAMILALGGMGIAIAALTIRYPPVVLIWIFAILAVAFIVPLHVDSVHELTIWFAGIVVGIPMLTLVRTVDALVYAE